MTAAQSFDRAQWLIVPLGVAAVALVSYLFLIGG